MLGQPDKAINDLKQAIDQSPIDAATIASKYFHLAQAYRLAETRDTAEKKQRVADAWALAKGAGFDAKSLHPLERTAYDKLIQELNSN